MNDTSTGSEQRELTVSEVAARDLPGARLRSTREQMGITVGDVAQSIKFSPRQIEALERDDHTALPPGPTFIRGFIRSYAKLLRVDAESLLDALPREVPVESPEPAKTESLGTRLPMPGSKRGLVPIAAVGALAVALAALAVHYFYRGDVKPSSTRQYPGATGEPGATPAAVPPVATVAEVPAAVVTAQPAATPLGATPASAAAPAASPVSAAAVPAAAVVGRSPSTPTTPAIGSAPVGAHHHQLIFTFDDKAWVEVKDASQRIIFSQNNSAGSRQIVSGTPPFDLVIGNASRVHLQYDTHPVDLAPDTRAEVARLTVQ